MIKKVIFLFFNFCLLGVLFGCNICNANSIKSSATVEIKSQDFRSSTFVENPYLDSCSAKCILLESTSEQELSNSLGLKAAVLFDTLIFYIRFSNPSKRCKSESHGLIERNITPVQHVSRQILFHSLQIHF